MTHPATPPTPQQPDGGKPVTAQPDGPPPPQWASSPPAFGQHPRPDPVSGTPPGPRPAAVTMGAVAMFGLGVVFILATGLATYDSTQRTSGTLSIAQVIQMLCILMLVVTAFAGGGLTLAGKSAGRVLSFVAAGAATYLACHDVSFFTFELVRHDGLLGLWRVAGGLLMLGAAAIGIPGIVMLGTRRANEWFAAQLAPSGQQAYPPAAPPQGQVPPPAGSGQPPG